MSNNVFYVGFVEAKPVFAVCDQVNLKPACLVTETGQSIKILRHKCFFQTLQKVNYKGAGQAVQMHRLVCVFVICIQ